MKNKPVAKIFAVMLLSCAVMALVDSVIQPGYAVKSIIKLIMFLLIPVLIAKTDKSIHLKSLFRFQRQGIGQALVLGIGIFILILGGYFLLSTFMDFSGIVGALSENAGVGEGNFLFVALYISFINSLLEEFFFRGFLFINLKKQLSRYHAYLISSLAFSLYHVAMMIGWFQLWLFLLILLGLVIGGMIFNYLDETQETIYTSWFTHMFANFAINTIGFILMK